MITDTPHVALPSHQQLRWRHARLIDAHGQALEREAGALAKVARVGKLEVALRGLEQEAATRNALLSKMEMELKEARALAMETERLRAQLQGAEEMIIDRERDIDDLRVEAHDREVRLASLAEEVRLQRLTEEGLRSEIQSARAAIHTVKQKGAEKEAELDAKVRCLSRRSRGRPLLLSQHGPRLPPHKKPHPPSFPLFFSLLFSPTARGGEPETERST